MEYTISGTVNLEPPVDMPDMPAEFRELDETVTRLTDKLDVLADEVSNLEGRIEDLESRDVQDAISDLESEFESFRDNIHNA